VARGALGSRDCANMACPAFPSSSPLPALLGGLKLLPQPVPAPPSTGEGLRRARRFLKKGIDKGKELQKEFPLPPPPFMPKSFLLEEREEEEPAGKSASTSPSRTGGQAWLRWPARWRRFRPPKVVGPTVIDLEPHLIA